MFAPSSRTLTVLAAALAAALPLLATAQTQVTKPPKATAYIDLATNSSDIPGMGMMANMSRGGGSGGMMGALGAMMGGGGGNNATGGNTFGTTHGQGFGAPGKYVDISVGNLKNPALQEAGQTVVTTFFPTPLKLISPPPPEKPIPADKDEPPPEYEKPKANAKISLYWGCGDTIRPGQPRTLDMSKSTMEDYQKFFTMRSSQSRGARLRYGEPSWPNKQDDRRVPESAQLAGEHQISGAGMPDNFKFTLDDRQDFLAPIALTQQKQGPGGAVQLEWQLVTYARGYFITAMGGQGGGRRGGGDSAEMVIWTSSELPEMGYALMDFQANGSIEQWVKDKVVLPATTTKCTVPKGIFGDDGAAMLRMVAYGGESYLAYPKRPTDPKVAYEPDWQVKVRSKSNLFSMLGGMPGGQERGDGSGMSPQQQQQQQQQQQTPGVGGLLKGLFGR